MKTIANVLIFILLISLLVLGYFIIKYIYLGNFLLERKVLGSIIAGIVGIPVFGRLIYILKDTFRKY